MENELILGTTVEEIVYLSIYFGTGLVLASIIKLTCIALKKNLRRDNKKISERTQTSYQIYKKLYKTIKSYRKR